MKRLLDLAVASVAILLLSPLLVAVALVIMVSMGRPVLFRQQRPGRNGRPFELIKFRTMTPIKGSDDAPERDHDRIPRVGRFLRATSIDELPELWNVVRGDMSLVGPRPLLMRYLARYTPEQARRHAVRPGLTGWAQVSGRNAITWEEKFALDVWYVDNRSFWLDLRILLLTMRSILRKDGINAGEEETMPEFLGSYSITSAGAPDRD
jgi:sugar transferase EpsL